MSAMLHLVTPDQCLVEHVSHALAGFSLSELRRTRLVVPTQRLGTALLVRLLESRSAIIPPEIVTLEGLIRGRERTEGKDESYGIAHDATTDLILRSLLEDKERPFVHLKHGHERELRLLHGELYDHGLREQGFANLKTTLVEDIYKNEAHLGSLYHRAEEMESILKQLDAELGALRIRVRSESLARDAEALASAWPENSEGLEHILFIGFTSMAKSWQVLLPTLIADTRVAFWLSEAPKLYHKQSPLQELLDTIEGLGPVLRREPAIQSEIKAFHCYVAPSLRDEVKWAESIVREAIGKGFAPARIGILVTDERLYGTALRTVFENSSLETNIALPESWGGTLAGRHLASVLQFWQEKQSLSSLLAFIDHPLTKSRWTESPDALQKLRRGLLQAGVPSGLELMHSELREELWDEFETLSLYLKPLRLDQTLSLSQWLERLEETVAGFAYWESFKGRDILQSSQEVYADFIASLRASGVRGPLMNGRTFWDLVESHLLKGSVRGTGEPLSGLQIMSLSEARYFPFDLAIILGSHEGCFPKALPQDELLDNYLKKRVGLPGWEMLEAMEDQTFHLLKSRLPNLILLRPSRLGEELLVRSRFTEALLARNGLHETVLPSAESMEAVVLPEPEFEGILPNWLEASTSRISASRLDKLLYCPYSFLLDSLGLHSEASPTDEADTRREGEWLHLLLQTFITGKGPKGEDFGRFVYAEATPESALSRLNEITERLAPADIRESALMHHLKGFAWPRYIQHLLGTSEVTQSFREYSFGSGAHPVTFTVGGKTRELHGRIDALDYSSQWTFVTDFKRRTVPTLDKSKKGLNAQLSIYALALSQRSPINPPRPLVLGYWNIYEGKWTAHGLDETHRALLLNANLATAATPTIDAMIDGLRSNWEWREVEIESKQRFFADPGDHCRLCDYVGICRKDDPRNKDRIAAQNSLELRLEALHA